MVASPTEEQDTTLTNDAGEEETDHGDPAEAFERQSCKKIFDGLAKKINDHVCAGALVKLIIAKLSRGYIDN